MSSSFSLTPLFWTFIAGGIGASSRVVLAAALERMAGDLLSHVGTLAVNLLGCLAIGLGAQLLPEGPSKQAIIGGALGGFTTYSAFALFSFNLIEEGRWGTLSLQLIGHLCGGVLAVALGMWIGRSLSSG